MLLLPSGRWEKKTHLSETKIHMDERKYMGITESSTFNANLIWPSLSPACWGHISMLSGENLFIWCCIFLFYPLEEIPELALEETNAPASISLLLILLTRRRSPTRPFPQCATESACILYCRCVCLCVWGMCVCSAWVLALHEHLMSRRVKDACVHAGVCIKACPCSFRVHAKVPSECTCMSLPLWGCACVHTCMWVLMHYHIVFSVMSPFGCRENVMHIGELESLRF